VDRVGCQYPDFHFEEVDWLYSGLAIETMATKSNLSAVLRKVDDLCLVRIHYISTFTFLHLLSQQKLYTVITLTLT
jgi:hypothetical protein